ncbi:MAG: hypothetical protein KKE00_03580 [Proteobacteria bacterium]|nr:hypothetical protein [Patescibacteria group bacterium]MBU1569593.1 hypothetical protein [Pseudomonadota bacterium]
MIFNLFNKKTDLIAIVREVVSATNDKIWEIQDKENQQLTDIFAIRHIFACVALKPRAEEAGREEFLKRLTINFMSAGLPRLVAMSVEDIYGSEKLPKNVYDIEMSDTPKAYKYIESNAPYNLNDRAVLNLILCSACISVLAKKRIEDWDVFERVTFAVMDSRF